MKCPMHPDPKPDCDAEGTCPLCGRSWKEMTAGGETYLMSKARKVQIVQPITEGSRIDDCIKPVE